MRDEERAKTAKEQKESKAKRVFRTKVDMLVEMVQEAGLKGAQFQNISAEVGISVNAVENISRMLERGKAVEIHYPLNIIQKPFVTFINMPEKAAEESKRKESTLEKYELTADFVPADVLITDTGRSKHYEISFINLGMGTRIFLDQVKDEMANRIPADTGEVSDMERISRLRVTFLKILVDEMNKYELGNEHSQILGGLLLHSMFGLGEIDVLTNDPWLEEIAINSAKTPVAVYHRKFGWLRTNLSMPNEEEVFNYASQIGRKVGRQIAVLTPIMDARLETGDRVCATLQPISSHGNTITIRKFARNPWTISTLVGSASKTMTPEMAAMLWQAIHYELNMIVAGGTASGKTSAMNALAAFIPPNQRIISIEDTRELMLPKNQWNWVPLVTRNPNPEGLGEVSMLDLLVTSLRMRPDRIILGEMRKQREAEVLFEAMHTGHSAYSTMHADTSSQVVRRLMQPPFEMPATELETLHLLLVQYRDRRKNLRRTLEIAEVGMGAQAGQITPNIIYRWRPRSDTFDKIGEPSKFYEEMNLHTGMTKEEIDDDQKERAGVIKWLVKNSITDVDDVGRVMAMYYADPEEVYKAARQNKAFAKLEW